MTAAETFSLLILLFIAGLCLLLFILPFEIEVGEADADDDVSYEAYTEDQRLASRKARKANKGAAPTSIA